MSCWAGSCPGLQLLRLGVPTLEIIKTVVGFHGCYAQAQSFVLYTTSPCDPQSMRMFSSSLGEKRGMNGSRILMPPICFKLIARRSSAKAS